MSSTQFDGDIDSFVSYLKSNRGLSANTLKAYRADLTACLHLFELRGVTDLNEITLDDLRSWMAVESRDHARSSMARKTVAVRGFFAWAYEHGVTNTDPAATLMTPSIPSTLPAVLTESQAEQLLDVAEQAVATNQYKGDGGAAAASGSGSGKAVGKTADKSADTVNRNEAPARADKRDSARVVSGIAAQRRDSRTTVCHRHPCRRTGVDGYRRHRLLQSHHQSHRQRQQATRGAVRTTRPACAGDLA